MSKELVESSQLVVPYSVDDLLNSVDYSFPGYSPSVDALNFMNFMQMVLGEPPENKSAMMHYFMIDVIFRNVDIQKFYGIHSEIMRENYFAVMIHREGAKSVLLGTMFVLYMAYYGSLPGFGNVNFGGYIGNSVRGGVRQNMQTIAGVYRDSDFLQDKFEKVHFTDTAVKFIRHPKRKADGSISKREAKEGSRTFVLEGYGAMAGPRGSRDGLTRPQFFIIDDVIKNAADSRSDIILGNIRSMIEEDIGYALHGGEGASFCIYIGTPFNLRDPLMNALIDGTWTPIVFPICERISMDMTEEEFSGSWEDRHSYKAVMTKYKTAVHKGTLPSFMQEQMLRVASDEDRLVPDSLINWYNRADIILNAHAYNWYFTSDFTSTGSRSSDFSGLAIWAAGADGNIFLVDLTLKKLELLDQYENIFDMVRKYKKGTGYIEGGIEIDGQQKAHIFALKQMMVKKNEYFSIARQIGRNQEGILRREVKGNKFEYFKLVVPLFQNSKIWFPNEIRETADMQELLDEIYYTSYTGIGSRSDDGLDLISMLSQLKIVYPDSRQKDVAQLEYNAASDIWEIEDEDINDDSGGIIF